jgi:hypothetical protein
LQFVPLQLQMLAVHVHDPDVLHVMLHTSPLHEQVLEPVHVRSQPPFGFWQLASQLSDPLHV